MLSFIIIGKNEGWKLTKCFESVFRTIGQNELTSFEVIYVDSNSTDDSIERTREFSGVKIFQITGRSNAAKARNIGAKESIGDILFFIDGDNEIIPEFLGTVYNENAGLFHNFVSGQFVDYNYTSDWKFIDKEYYFKNLSKDKVKIYTAGGLFLIKSEIWKQVGGMSTALDVNEDIEFGIRVAKSGFNLIRKVDLISIHHTVPYINFSRRWKSLLKGNEMYRVLVMRDNFFNIFAWRLFFRENYSVITLFLSAILIWITGIGYLLAFYLLLIIARGILNKKNEKVLNVLRFGVPFYMLRDISIILGFLFFYKKKTEMPFYIKLDRSLKNDIEKALYVNHKLSIIIIGRNEGWKLTKCLESVYETINKNLLSNFEIIYIDSDSTDDSIQRALSFKTIKVIQLTGDYNASIARNKGVQECSGDALFFIDGDMEIMPDFLSLVFDENAGLKEDFVSGNFIDINYDFTGKIVDKKEYLSNRNGQTYEFKTGGLFLIRKEIWDKIGGMRNKLKRNQDIDLGIRLAKTGVFLLRRNELMAIHHTISYHNYKRIWKLLFSDSELYRGVLLRDNILNRYQWKLFFRENYSAVLLMISIYVSSFTKFHFLFIIYLFIILLRGFLKQDLTIFSKINIAFYYLARDASFLFGFLFFWPGSDKQISFKKI
jgi:glycosyltransferase involved in cell wall biosynthesis